MSDIWRAHRFQSVISMHAQVNYKPAFGRMSSICSLGHVFSALLIVKMVPRQTQRLMAFVFPEVAFACVFSRGRWLYKGNRNLPYVMVAFSLYTFDLCKRHNPASRRVSSFTSGPFSICRGAFKSLVELIPVVGREAIYSQSICFNCVFLSAGCSRALPVSKAGQSTSRLQTWSCFMAYVHPLLLYGVSAYVHPGSLVTSGICM